jgi:hypothetical protein
MVLFESYHFCTAKQQLILTTLLYKLLFMFSEKLSGEDLLALQNEKGNICASVVVPVHRLSHERRVDKLGVKRAVEKAGQLLRYKYPEKQTAPLLKALDELYKTIDFKQNPDGIGLYVSATLKLAVQFPFPVEEKIMAGNNFEIRDLLYKINYAAPYYMLILTEKGARFFEGREYNLTEIKDNHFPVEYEDDYAYSKPSRSSSYAGHSHVKIYEKDKSEMEAIRFRNFFKKVDKLLDKYLVRDMPLVLLGVEKELALFTGVSSHTKKIAAKIAGSYNYENEKELTDRVWPAIRSYLENGWAKLVKEFQEKIGEGLGISGIQDIWNAVQEGKAFKLLVEKDYRSPGFLTENEYQLYLRPPKKPHKILADAVDDLIEAVLEKKGHVFFVDNGMLKDYQRMALITRY